MLSRNALGNMHNRYTAVLTKCRFMNIFGSLAMVTALCFGSVGHGVGHAVAGSLPDSGDVTINVDDIVDVIATPSAIYGDTTVQGKLTIWNGAYSTSGFTWVRSGGLLDIYSGTYNAQSTTSGTNLEGALLVRDNGAYNAFGTTTLAQNGSLTVQSGTYTAHGATTFTGQGFIRVQGGTYNADSYTYIQKGGTLAVTGNGVYDATGQRVTVADEGTVYVEQGTVITGDTSGTGTGLGTGLGTGSGAPPNSLVAKELIINGGMYNAQGQAVTVADGGMITASQSTVITGSSVGFDRHSLVAKELIVHDGAFYNAGSTNADWVTKAINAVNLDAVNLDVTGSGVMTLDPSSLAILAIAKGGALTVKDGGTLSVGLGAVPTTVRGTPTGPTPKPQASINFGGNSLLVVDAEGLKGSYALTGESIKATDGAKLLVSNVQFKAGAVTVNIADAADSVTQTGNLTINDAWGSEGAATNGTGGTGVPIDLDTTTTLYFDNGLIAVASYLYNSADGTYSLILAQLSAESTFDDTKLDPELADLLDKANDGGELSGFLGDATKLENKHEAAAIIEGAAKMAVNAGVLQTAWTVAERSMDAVEHRTSVAGIMPKGSVLLQDSDTMPDPITDATMSHTMPQPNNGMANGLALWMQPMYESVRAHGLHSGKYSYGYDTDMYGASLGADYTVHNAMRFGLALHVGGGNTSSHESDFAHTKNDFDYVGTSLYASYLFNNIGLSANLGYAVTQNALNQETRLGNLHSDDFDVAVFSAGARAEYKLATDIMDIIPYIGAQLNHFRMDSFDVKSATETVYHTAETHATTVSIPLGITLSKDIHMGGVHVAPWAAFGMQCTMGDLDVAQNVSMPHVTGAATLESAIFDPVTFTGGLGFDMHVDSVSFGFEYNLGASENVTSHQFGAKVEYRF